MTAMLWQWPLWILLPHVHALRLIDLDTDEEPEGLEVLLERYTEPYGVAVAAYVDEDGANQQLLRKMDKKTRENATKLDLELRHLKVPVVSLAGWQREGGEHMVMYYRTPFQDMWPMVGGTAMDAETPIFKKKGKWKEKDVKKWLMDLAWPTINIRSLESGNEAFPEDRYFGPGNGVRGVALIFANLTGEKEVKAQWDLLRLLRPHAERLKHRLRFSIVERTKETRDMRMFWGCGLDLKTETELLLVEKLKWANDPEQDPDIANYWHGNPNKYRLQNVTSEKMVSKFFEDFEKGTLPSYWVSKEEWNSSSIRQKPADIHSVRVTGNTFEERVWTNSPRKGLLLAYFMDDPKDGCVQCEQGRREWEAVAKMVKATQRLRDRLEVLSLDQSANEHPESKVPAKLGQPIVFWYPPGDKKKRMRGRRKLGGMTEFLYRDAIMKAIDDLLMDEFEEGEL